MRHLLQRCPVIPVLTIEDTAHAVPLAEALVAGGLTVLEVTLRTPAALASIRAIRAAVPEAIVGAGTIINAAQYAPRRGGKPVRGLARMLGQPHRRGEDAWCRCCRATTPTEIIAALDAASTR